MPIDYQALKERVGVDPHVLSDAIDEASDDPQERLEALFCAFEDNPSYGIAMYVTHAYLDGDQPLRNRTLARFRTYLEGPDGPIVEQTLYVLWCDFFETPELAAEVWRALVGPGSSPILLRRILPASGPVPWELKAPILESLVAADRWHVPIFQCLLHSQFDVFGQIDRPAARSLLRRLRLPEGLEHHARLGEALQT